MGLDQRKGRALSLQPITQAARVATHPKPPQNSFPQLSKCIDNEARAILCIPVRATSSYLMSPLVDTFGKPEHLEKAELVDLCGEKWGLGSSFQFIPLQVRNIQDQPLIVSTLYTLVCGWAWKVGEAKKMCDWTFLVFFGSSSFKTMMMVGNKYDDGRKLKKNE